MRQNVSGEKRKRTTFLKFQGLVLLFLVFASVPIFPSEGKFINPVSDICWSCMFPIHIAGKNSTPKHKDFVKYRKATCSCPGGVVGVPFAFWEPSRMVEVTRTPYKLLSLGGITLGKNPLKNGTISDDLWEAHSFYHVHYLVSPFLALLESGIEFVCIENLPLDIGYMSEYDPFWNDDSWSSLLNPEGLLFGNPIAQVACIADCAAASFEKPIEKLFWCAGCQGSLYPFTGHCSHPSGDIQTSSLMVHRLLAKLASIYTLKSFKEGEFCKKKPSRRIRKTAFKTQLVYPKAQTKGPCNALGRSGALWGSGMSLPLSGEEFVYVIWQKSHCCLDPVKIAKKVAIGGAG